MEIQYIEVMEYYKMIFSFHPITDYFNDIILFLKNVMTGHDIYVNISEFKIVLWKASLNLQVDIENTYFLWWSVVSSHSLSVREKLSNLATVELYTSK